MDSTSSGNQAPSGINEFRHSQRDREAYAHDLKSWEASEIHTIDKLEAFPRFSTKRSVARFIVKQEIFKKILGINGSIIECGMFNGAGLFAWATLSEIYEPVNYTRKIIGYDTFADSHRSASWITCPHTNQSKVIFAETHITQSRNLF